MSKKRKARKNSPAVPTVPSGARMRASAVSRLIAFIVDCLITGAAAVFLLVVSSFAAGALGLSPALASSAFYAVLSGLVVLIGSYFMLFETSSLQATPGKQLVGLKVVGDDGEKLPANIALARTVVKLLVVSLLPILCISVIFDRKGRAPHDFFGSRVVSLKG